jgi:hypothetical protein
VASSTLHDIFDIGFAGSLGLEACQGHPAYMTPSVSRSRMMRWYTIGARVIGRQRASGNVGGWYQICSATLKYASSMTRGKSRKTRQGESLFRSCARCRPRLGTRSLLLYIVLSRQTFSRDLSILDMFFFVFLIAWSSSCVRWPDLWRRWKLQVVIIHGTIFGHLLFDRPLFIKLAAVIWFYDCNERTGCIVLLPARLS